MTANTKNYLGIDVCKAHLDVATGRPQIKRYPNTPSAINAWLRLLPADSHLVVEATGGYERALTQACHQQALCVSVVNPARVRHFAKARGQLAKTDPIDAKLLREFGLAIGPAPQPAPDPAQSELAELVAARDLFVAQRVVFINGLEHACNKLVCASYRSSLAEVDKQIAELEAAMAALMAAGPALAARAAALRAHRGLGPATTACLLAYLPELGRVGRNQISALAGLAPFNRDSGQSSGLRYIQGGRAKVRRALFMAALSAVRSPSPIGDFYRRLRARAKPAKVALIAAARKLLCLLNSALKNLPA